MGTDKNMEELLDRYLRSECTPQEEQLVENWLEKNRNTSNEWEKMNADDKRKWMESLLTDIKNSAGIIAPVRTIYWKRWIAAASVMLLLGLGSYFALFNKHKQQQISNNQSQPAGSDALPGSYKAKLTLADGRTIVLDSAQLGELAKQGNTSVINKNGELVYNGSQLATHNSQLLYNTLTTAKGETYATILADGSKVWLNSGSSIKYPVAFIGNERKVEITGEAYFEIAHDAAKPFIVNANNNGEVEVLGTHFNVNAYQDEDDLKVTLLEGSVKFSQLSTHNSQLIKPGQQVVLTNNGQLSTNNADIDETMAWKEGFFQFDHTSSKQMLQQLSRWYDVEVLYEGNMPDRQFGGRINRQLKLSQVLTMLKNTGIHYKIEGKKLIVSN